MHTFTFCHLDCLSITQLFDRIEDVINTMVDEEVKCELIYDLGLVWDSVFQLMGHQVRTTQQGQQKRNYIDALDESTAFLTVDWSQKVLPQKFREGQSPYFGKKGMSLLVGTFAFKAPSQGEEPIIVLLFTDM